MKYSLTTRNIEISDGEKDQLEEKLDRLKKHLVPPFQVDVLLKKDTHHNSGDVVQCTLKLVQAGPTLYADRSSESVQSALDACLQALQHELEKVKTKKKRGRLSWRNIFGR